MPDWITVSFPSGTTVVAEEAVDRAWGLTGRAHLSDDEGMFFDMSIMDDHRFWMRGVPIPLDIIFFDTNGIVVGIITNAEPFDVNLRSIGRPSRYVLEVAGGWCFRNGVLPGQRASIA